MLERLKADMDRPVSEEVQETLTAVAATELEVEALLALFPDSARAEVLRGMYRGDDEVLRTTYDAG